MREPRAADEPEPLLETAAAVLGTKPPQSRAVEFTKGADADDETTGAPGGGRSTLAEARQGGITGYLQLLGPGLITGASDDDPSGIGTYSQVGSQFGYGLLWTALFTFPLMAAVQELCARIALRTNAGLGTTLRRRFPTPLVGLCVFALLVANTINVGADLGAVAAGGQLLSGGAVRGVWPVLAAGVLIGGLQLFSSYRVIFRLFKYLTLALFAYVATVFIVHPDAIAVVAATVVPHVELSSGFITALVAVLGTTISPYLFFWQASSEAQEASPQRGAGRHRHVRDDHLKAARIDIFIGMAFSQLVMYCIILTNGAVLHAHGLTNVQTAQDAASALRPLAGPFASVLFAIGLIGTGLLAIPILAGSAAYAVKEVAGFRGSLAIRVRHAPTFYGLIVLSLVVGVLMNTAGIDPIRALFVTAVINGIVAPPLLTLIVVLGSDRTVMGDNVSGVVSKVLTWSAVAVMSAAVVGLVVTTWGPWAG